MFEDSELEDYDLMRLADRYCPVPRPPPDPAPWHPTDGVSRYYGMVFYWFDRNDFDIWVPASVVNTKLSEDDPAVTTKFYIRWGGMHRGAFCIIVQEPRSISKRIPKPDRPATWQYTFNFVGWRRPFPDRSKMRWGYVNIGPQQIYLHWWHTFVGERGVNKLIDGFTYTGKYWLKDWPHKDPLYFVYQRILRQLASKDWKPEGSYFDLRKM